MDVPMKTLRTTIQTWLVEKPIPFRRLSQITDPPAHRCARLPNRIGLRRDLLACRSSAIGLWAAYERIGRPWNCRTRPSGLRHAHADRWRARSRPLGPRKTRRHSPRIRTLAGWQ